MFKMKSFLPIVVAVVAGAALYDVLDETDAMASVKRTAKRLIG